MTGKKKGVLSWFGGGGKRKHKKKGRNSASPRRSKTPPECKKCKANSAPSTPRCGSRSRSRSRSPSPRGGSRQGTPRGRRPRRRAGGGGGCFGGSKGSKSPHTRSGSGSPEISPHALPIEYWQDSVARHPKLEHACKSPRRGCADHRCHKEKPRSTFSSPKRKLRSVKAAAAAAAAAAASVTLVYHDTNANLCRQPAAYKFQLDPSSPSRASSTSCERCRTTPLGHNPAAEGLRERAAAYGVLYVHVDLRYLSSSKRLGYAKGNTFGGERVGFLPQPSGGGGGAFLPVERPLEPVEADQPVPCPRPHPFTAGP